MTRHRFAHHTQADESDCWFHHCVSFPLIFALYASIGPSRTYENSTVSWTVETRTFSVPTPIFGGSSEVRLRAVPLGSQDSYTSEWIAAGPGDRVEWKLASILKLSTFQVR